ncbi:putative protein family UPF0642 [Cordyceps fumosorosea ARSEF 2679]|uniref:DUF2423 domain-containing protein n=1 Tax=Cordyceps fumosorosea (strain ARSEF 2679) TaxID=1081104 RepID=A0A167S823_CORFA|nr:putative protein family UPF0642 [Cordyceps fumosorosea ARSEF 2679]OAA59354.1 putative protein family UPF0642 [Cordyceps fumosorosea ARSEF 2679]
MAKSSRSSTRKENNRRLAATVFGPAETARAERLSAKLLELAKQPKPETSDANMEEAADVVEDEAADAGDATGMVPVIQAHCTKSSKQASQLTDSCLAMDVDTKRTASKRVGRKRIDKRKTKKASIVFPKYSDRIKAKKNKKKA